MAKYSVEKCKTCKYKDECEYYVPICIMCKNLHNDSNDCPNCVGLTDSNYCYYEKGEN